ncbi:MAG: ATP-dependent carboxylate-amine ligase [Pseudomonadota bacterium]
MFIPLQPTERDRPFLHLLQAAAAELGAEVHVEPRFRHVGQIQLGAQRKLFFGNALSLNGDASATLAADKTYTAELLAGAGLPTPRGCLTVSPRFRETLALKSPTAAAALPDPDAVFRFVEKVGYPVFVKPNRGTEGSDVSQADTVDTLQTDLERLFSHTSHARVEAFVPGQDYRVLVLNGVVRAVYRRDPLHITGDGQTPIRSLIDLALARLARGPRLSVDDPRILRCVAAAGYTTGDRLPKGQKVALLPNANLSTGGSLTDMTGRLPATFGAMAVQAAEHLGLRLAGVDLIAEDMAAPTILEVNSAPGFDFYARSSPTAWNIARQILVDALQTGEP